MVNLIILGMANGIVYAYSPENFPTKARGTGMGLASATGRLGGILGPTIVGIIYSFSGIETVLHINMAVLLFGSLVVMVLAKQGIKHWKNQQWRLFRLIKVPELQILKLHEIYQACIVYQCRLVIYNWLVVIYQPSSNEYIFFEASLSLATRTGSCSGLNLNSGMKMLSAATSPSVR